MRHKTFSILAFASFAALIPAPAGAFSLGGLFGLVSAPLNAVTHGMLGGGRPMHHPRGGSAHALALPREAAHAPAAHREAAREERGKAPAAPASAPRTEVKLEPPRGEPPGKAVQAAPQPPPAAPALPAAAWPASSPSAYEDLVGYILWPRDYADRLWAHGYDDILGTVLTPANAAHAKEAAGMISAGMCSEEARNLADKPIGRLGEIIKLAQGQEAALDDLRAAVGQAIERGRIILCGGTFEPAGDGLKPMLDGLWTVWDATILMRGPLERFLDSLTPGQTAELQKAGEMTPAAAGACAEPDGDQHQAPLNDRMGQMIAAATGQNPSPGQARKLDALRQQFAELAKFLSSCPQANGPTPISRLSAAGELMNALMYAVASMAPAAGAFHAAGQQTNPSGAGN
jgi:hypothetical protein